MDTLQSGKADATETMLDMKTMALARGLRIQNQGFGIVFPARAQL